MVSLIRATASHPTSTPRRQQTLEASVSHHSQVATVERVPDWATTVERDRHSRRKDRVTRVAVVRLVGCLMCLAARASRIRTCLLASRLLTLRRAAMIRSRAMAIPRPPRVPALY